MTRVEPPRLSEIGNLDVKRTGRSDAEYSRSVAAADVAETSSLAFGKMPPFRRVILRSGVLSAAT
jgi:hypothetical protein